MKKFAVIIINGDDLCETRAEVVEAETARGALNILDKNLVEDFDRLKNSKRTESEETDEFISYNNREGFAFVIHKVVG